MRRLVVCVAVLVLCVANQAVFGQDEEASALAKATQNPVADLISLPLQSNFNTGVGGKDDLQYVLNVQPVIPTGISEDWNLINRLILPVMYQPEITPGVGKEWGLGNSVYQGFISPKEAKSVVWGVGPVVQIPTSTDDQLFGLGEWGLGPTLVALVMPGPWVIGSTIYNVWSVESSDVNLFLWQYFINYNFPNGAYLTSAPIITANWEADSDQRWTVPFGIGAGKVFKIGKQPINSSLQAYYNVEKPDLTGADWQIRLQFQLLFPK